MLNLLSPAGRCLPGVHDAAPHDTTCEGRARVIRTTTRNLLVGPRAPSALL
jgi:hypothetical protein